jgi:hypothetical protein
MTDPRAYALDLVTRALADELREPITRDRAEAFIAVAEQAHVLIETLLVWIHTPATGKQWTLAEWRRFCEHFAAEQRQLAKEPPQGTLFSRYDTAAFDPE